VKELEAGANVKSIAILNDPDLRKSSVLHCVKTDIKKKLKSTRMIEFKLPPGIEQPEV
jgi:hypothetical protein